MTGRLPVAPAECFSVIYSVTGAEHVWKLCQSDGPVFNWAARQQMCKHRCFAVRNIRYLGLGDQKDPVALRVALPPARIRVCRTLGCLLSVMLLVWFLRTWVSLLVPFLHQAWVLLLIEAGGDSGSSWGCPRWHWACQLLHALPKWAQVLLPPWKVTSWLVITSDLPLTQLGKFSHFYGPSRSNF